MPDEPTRMIPSFRMKRTDSRGTKVVPDFRACTELHFAAGPKARNKPAQGNAPLPLLAACRPIKNAGHPERSAAVGEGGAARSRRIPWHRGWLPNQASISICEDIIPQSHGILRLRCARLSASAPLRMASRGEVFQQAANSMAVGQRPGETDENGQQP